jgi:hypothetical protein
MNHNLKPIVALVALVCAAQANAQAPASKPKGTTPAPTTATAPVVQGPLAPLKIGLWEQVLETDATASTPKRLVTARLCITPDDNKTYRRIVPPQPDSSFKCDVHDLKLQGSELSWKLSCTGAAGSMLGAGKATLTASAYSGSSLVELTSKGPAVKLSQKITAKWVEACK